MCSAVPFVVAQLLTTTRGESHKNKKYEDTFVLQDLVCKASRDEGEDLKTFIITTNPLFSCIFVYMFCTKYIILDNAFTNKERKMLFFKLFIFIIN